MKSKYLSVVASAAIGIGTISVTTPAQAVELVTNGGFETGNFAGWTLSGNTGFTSVTSNPTYVHSGTYGAALGPVNSNGEISQWLNTITGATYTISFWLRNDGGTPNDFYAYFGSQQLLATVNQGASAWFNYTYQATDTAPTLLRFSFQQNPAYWGLDDISVQGPLGAGVPEPGTWAMMLLGFGGIGMAMRRRRQPKLAQVAEGDEVADVRAPPRDNPENGLKGAVMKTFHKAMVATAMLCTSTIAAADTTIDFDGLPGSNGSAFSGPYVEEGYTTTATGGQVFEGHIFGNPTPSLVVGSVFNGGSTGSVQVTASTLFTLVSFDQSAQNGAAGYSVQGFLGASLLYTLTGSVPGGFQTIAGNSIAVDRVVFSLTSGGTSTNLDNIVLGPVPEPATWAMMLLGFGGIGMAMRSKRKPQLARAA